MKSCSIFRIINSNVTTTVKFKVYIFFCSPNMLLDATFHLPSWQFQQHLKVKLLYP